MPRFQALTGFRCLAACLVFLYHNRKYWRSDLHPEILRLFNEFHIGVSLFFVLSGFLIAYTYADEPIKSGNSYLKYIAGRLLRIMPVYWLILTFYYLDPKFGNLHFSGLTYSLFHGFSQKYNLVGIAQAWSLSVEMTFYLFAPLLVFLQKKHFLYLLGFLTFLYLVFVAIGFAWNNANGNPGQWFSPFRFIAGATFPGRCTEFLAGMYLAQYLKIGATWLQKWKYKTAFGFVGIFLTAYAIGLFEPDVFHHGSDHPIGFLVQNLVLPIFTVLALAGLIFENTVLQRFFGSRWLVLLGNASFAFYLVHISYVNLKIKSWILLPDRNFVLLWLVSIAFYLLFEKPIYDWGRKKLKGIK